MMYQDPEIPRIENLLELTKKLRDFLQKLIDGRIDKEIEEWKNPSVWIDVVKYFDTLTEFYIYDIVGLAEVQVGLSKYFDFYSTDWMTKSERIELRRLVARIVLLAVNLLPPPGISGYSYCGGYHEDGACVKGQLGRRFLGQNPTHIPARDLKNFLDAPNLITLDRGTQLYRVVGIKNKPFGNWWFRKNFPLDRKSWRKDFAVTRAMNLDHYYVTCVLPRDLDGWSGIAASQRVPMQSCILEGGEEQIWLDPNDLLNMGITLHHIMVQNIRPAF